MPVKMELFVFNVNICSIFLPLLAFLSLINSSEVPRPRGVSLSRASLYSSNGDFACFDNTKTIPFSQVNDDYCDCLDGSDEPGTTACPNGVFHCTNAGHKPLNIPSNRVNDGICDCCDGTDEYAGKTCANVCLQLGRFAREEAQRLAEIIKEGKQLKTDLSQRGAQLKQEKQEKLTQLQRHKEEAEKVKKEKQSVKDEIEERENAALDIYRKLEEEEKKRKAQVEEVKKLELAESSFKQFDSNGDGYVEISELQSRTSFDKDKNGEVSVEEARYFLTQDEPVDFETFLTYAWPNIQPYLIMDQGLYKPPVTEPPTGSEADDLNEPEKDEKPAEWDEEEEEEEDEDEEAEQVEEQVNEPPKLQYDDETQKLVEQATAVRGDYSQAEKDVRDIETEIKNINDYLEKDFGPEEEFATLLGECFEYADHEYVYKLCLFDHTTQQPKSGGSETRLGAWGRWDGPEGNKYEAMLYDRGQSCWNGPQRSSKVKITCGIENKVISVTEPHKCEYAFEFTTPAACRDLVDEGDTHDEL